jgi:hypothetical protein
LGYGVGLDVVVVVVLDELLLDEFEAGVDAVVVLVVVFVVSFVFSFVAGGFTTVVLFSVFFSAGGVFTVSVFCSHAAKSAAPAKMQNSFFIVVDWLPMSGQI